MLLIVGTVPEPDFPLVHGPARLDRGGLLVDGHRVAVHRGTPALVGAACATAAGLGLDPPHALLAGDTGLGHGSRAIYDHLTRTLKATNCDVLLFHYLQPDVDWHNKVLFAVQAMTRQPLLVADAGFMYAAKMSGQAPVYDLFTPDMGELAFLADEAAPHPFYTRGFILQQEMDKVEELMARARLHHNAARTLLVKGASDVISHGSGITARVDSPVEPVLEAIGGTGDTVAGLAGVLLDAGLEVTHACRLAAMVNRYAGSLARPTPATQIKDIVAWIPQALTRVRELEPGAVPGV